jgi:hypothetical protein
MLAVGTAATLVIELILAFLIFLPRRLRALAALCILIFQLLILLTGNYGFFNLLTIALCVFLFDDAAIRHAIPRKLSLWIQNRAPRPGEAATACALVLTLVVLPVGAARISQALAFPKLPVVDAVTQAISPWLIVNAYGPFATTTTSRPEIIVQGSNDGQSWRAYDFRYKPGPVDRRPSWNIPHQPRLDWQMWFEALRLEEVYKATGTIDPRTMSAWFQSFLMRLMKSEPNVVGLLAKNPFPDQPPKSIRIKLYQYRFTTAAEANATGDWWHRDLVWTGPEWSSP